MFGIKAGSVYKDKLTRSLWTVKSVDGDVIELRDKNGAMNVLSKKQLKDNFTKE